MKRFMLVTIAACSIAGSLHAQPQRGGRGGGFNPAAGAAVARPNMQAGQVNPQINRPNPGMQQMQRPQVSMGGMQSINRPATNIQQPNIQRPATMPSMPSQINRPTTLPNVNRPSGGMTPGGLARPSFPGNTGTLPNRPGGQQPVTTLPGVTRPSGPANPWASPNITNPGVGGINRPGAGGPATLPGTGGVTRPGTGGNTRPGAGGPATLPGTGGVTRPGTGGNTRPGAGGPTTLPGTTRPGSGVDIGLDRPHRPTPPIGGPGNVISPNLPGTRPGGDRPGINRPGVDRPVVRPPTDRPVVNKGIYTGNQFNTNINHRPNWVNINNTQITNINNTWNNTIVNQPQMHNWVNNNPNRGLYWNNWGNGIRNNWYHNHYHNHWFGGDWWSRYQPAAAAWNYRAWLPYYPYNYWWSVPTFAGVTTWFNWNAANSAAWQQPVFYDYGTGGNVVYQNNQVYIGGQQVASAPEFAQSAAALATVTPPASEEEGAKVEWMPLGTFAMSTGEKDTEPTRVLQLAVTKDGIIGGTFFNYQTDQAVSIQGQVDKQTQRVAFRIGERDNLVAETGLYNLTQQEAPLLVHFGDEKVENFLLIRLKSEGEEQPK